MLLRHFDDHERLCRELLDAQLPLPAYEQMLKASHTFNLLDARRAISVTERQRYILRVRTLAAAVAQAYLREPRGARLSAAARRSRCRAGAREMKVEHARLPDRDRHRGAAARGAAHARARARGQASPPAWTRPRSGTASSSLLRRRAGSRCG